MLDILVIALIALALGAVIGLVVHTWPKNDPAAKLLGNPYQSPEAEGASLQKQKRVGLDRLLFDMGHPVLLLIALPAITAIVAVMVWYFVTQL